VTKNPDDFEALQLVDANHPGIFAIYQDNDPRDMSNQEVAEAIQNIVNAAIPVGGAFHKLNSWRYYWRY